MRKTRNGPFFGVIFKGRIERNKIKSSQVDEAGSGEREVLLPQSGFMWSDTVRKPEILFEYVISTATHIRTYCLTYSDECLTFYLKYVPTFYLTFYLT